jgi:hypothetical protein
MKNSLLDLNNHLFAQMERLADEDVKGDALKDEIDRARAVTAVSKQIITNASLVLRAEQLKYDGQIRLDGNEKFLGVAKQ